MKRILCSILCLVYFAFCSGCVTTGEGELENIEETSEAVSMDYLVPENDVGEENKLVVYLSGISHDFINENASSEEERVISLYPSKYTVGFSVVGGEMNCPYGNIFAKALADFTKKTDIPIEIHFLEEYTGPSDCLQVIYDEGRELPDMLLVGRNPHYDYPRLAKQGLLLDFTEYAALDETLQDTELYYKRVIEGGKIRGRQYAMPILFTMNGMITSDSYLQSIGKQAPKQGETFEDILFLLEEGCKEEVNSDKTLAIFENSGMMIGGQYLPSILTAAAYPNYFDENMENVLLQPKIISSIFEMMKWYNRQDAAAVLNGENNSYLQNTEDLKLKSSIYQAKETEIEDGIGFVLSGGRSGGRNMHSNLLTDAAYFQTFYQKHDEEMVLYGIPTIEDAEEYSANISLAAFGFQTTQHPEEVYQLARYLMDYEFPPFYGFSIHRENTQKQLNDVQKTTTTIYPDSVWGAVTSGSFKLEELQEMIQKIEPMDAKYIAIIQNMLENIAGAGLPYHPLEGDMYRSMLYKDLSPQETAEWIIEHLKEHLKMQEDLEPFYDAAYNDSIWN